MSQRRAAANTTPPSGEGSSSSAVRAERSNGVAVESLTLEGPFDEVDPQEMVPLSVEQDYQMEKHKLRRKKWYESPFAIGLTEPTWMAERFRSDPSNRGHGDNELEPDSSGCLCFSAQICPLFGAARLGNMVVLKSSQEWVEEVTDDEETGEQTTRRFTRPVLNIVLGPYWPMMLFVTYPLILGVSGWTFFAGILYKEKPFPLVFFWFFCTIGLIVALALTGCRDPGILHKYSKPPPQDDGTWRWTDQTQSYRPRGSYYDTDTAVVVEGFDHTCPWTGTAIGKRNMLPFQAFVCLVFVCMILDIFILTGAF